jgi:hypothetical protein
MRRRLERLRPSLRKVDRVTVLTEAKAEEINLQETPSVRMMDFILHGKAGEIDPKPLHSL